MSKAIIDYSILFYEALDKEANDETIDNVPNVRVFRGGIVKVFRRVGCSQSYYSQIRKALTGMGCVTILQQGSRDKPTIAILHHAPDREEFLLALDERLTPRMAYATLAQEVKDVKRRVGGMNIVEAFKTTDQRLRELELAVAKLSQTHPVPKRKGEVK